MALVADWYNGQTIMVTGGTGFMGKVLVEKLLRSCPEVRRIYILARPRRGTAPAARIEEMTKLPLFESIMKKNPDVVKKLVAVESDMTKPNLGLANDQKQQLLSEVNIVFNMAASLRLEAGLKSAVANNTTGTKNVLDLCTEMQQLKAFIHLSTAFCHCEHDTLEEKIYTPPHNPHDIIHAMEWMDDKTIEMITPRILGVHPNCYTYSKRLAESLVYEYREKFPVCVARPSIVVPTYSDPIPGWVDTLNGPVGVLVGAGKGVIRSMMCNPEYPAETIPVDTAINALITIAWKCGIQKSKDVPVYNISSGSIVDLTWGELIEKGQRAIHENPFEYTLWYPGGSARTSWLVHTLCVIFFHYLPAYFIDFMFLLTRNKRFMVRLQNKISIGLEVLQYFTMRKWIFNNENFRSIEKSLSDEDRKIFYMVNVNYDVNKYLVHLILGARVYCMKEPLSSLPRTRRNHFMLYCLHYITKFAFYGFLVWLLFQHIDSIRILLNYSAAMLYRVPLIGALVPFGLGDK